MGPRLAGLGAVAALSWFVAACGDQDAGTIFPGQDTFADAVADTSPSDTTADASADTSSPDTSADVGPGDTREPPDTVAPLTGFKDDGRFIVPGQIAKKTWPAVAGSLVAWVEGTDAGPVLVVWDTQVLTNPPRVYLVQNLVNPRELTLSDAFLAYVDDRYGDPDVFALDLETGVERAVVTRPGAQEKPSIIGSRVAWEDCRDCVTGGGVPGRESQRQVVERDLAGGAERIVASGAGGAFAPRYGLLGDGRQALVWVEGRATLGYERLEPGLAGTWDVDPFLADDQEVGTVDVVQGLIAWRPRPLIVNPDSMIVNPDSMWPSDVFTTRVDTGETEALTTRAELSGSVPGVLDGLGARLAWLESVPGAPRTGRFVRAELASGAVDVLFTLDEVEGMALGASYAVVTASRSDNDGEPDLHLFPLP